MMSSWDKELKQQYESPYMTELQNFIKSERALGKAIYPTESDVFNAFKYTPLDQVKVVILGQDPYHGEGQAHGLAFSVEASVTSLPASLRNIFKELQNDLGITRSQGDLSDWCDQGVMLINRILTTDVGESLAHEKLGWQEITNAVAQILGKNEVLAVLWGNSALELKSFFPDENVVSSVHPSPLSAYRGFFGSKPFSQVNAKLLLKGHNVISW
jgi:uracil-DNA glycosylase